MLMQSNLTPTDLEVIKSFLLPIQLNIPESDNPKLVTTVLLMATCGMIEHIHFGTPYASDASFESDEYGYGMELFTSCINETGDVREAAIKYLHYLNTGRTDAVVEKPSTQTPGKNIPWYKTILLKLINFLNNLVK